MVDLEAAVAKAHEATERILAERAEAERQSQQRILDSPQHQHAGREHDAPQQTRAQDDDGGMER
jgi:hypothetical protein